MSSSSSGAQSQAQRQTRPQTQPQRITIAVESGPGDVVLKAHAVSPAMLDLGRHGLTACGFPLEQLRMAPDLDWASIAGAKRCEHCASEGPILSTAG